MPCSSDLTRQRFGKLVVMERTDKKKDRYYLWHCRCECGNELDVTEDGLTSGSYKSCGCLLKEVQANIPNTLHHVGGTCVEHLEKKKIQK